MKKSEALIKYRDKIAEALVEVNKTMLENDGVIEYAVYVWSDGEIRVHERFRGSTSFLVPKDFETRSLFFITTVEIGGTVFDPWEYLDHSEPDDEAQREKDRQDVIDYLVDVYRDNIDSIMETLIEEAKRGESDE